MSRRVHVFWMVVSLAIILTTVVITPIAQADPAHQGPTPTPELSIIEAAIYVQLECDAGIGWIQEVLLK